MATFLIILSCLLFAGALALVPKKILLAPACAYIGLVLVSLAKSSDGYPLVPINATMLTGWLCMTIVVMTATILQPLPLRESSRGTGYLLTGALTGMAVGLLASSSGQQPAMMYGIMIAATVAGTFLGFLLYTRTPQGRPVGIGSGNFFKYLLAKGFPTAITVMQPGMVCVLLIAVYGR